MTTTDFGGKFGISFPRSKPEYRLLRVHYALVIATGYISRAPLTNPSTDQSIGAFFI